MDQTGFRSPLADIRETKLETYANDPQRISQDFKLEAADSADYSRRFVFELLQNADDEMPAESDRDRSVRFELQDDRLLVANNGRPFEAADLEAITMLTQTTKGGNGEDATIGHKGRGFTSVLDITENPAVFSRADGVEVAAQFDRQQTREKIRERLVETGTNPDEHIENVPLMPLPFPASVDPTVERLLEDGFSTVFVLPFTESRAERSHDVVASTLFERISRETVALLPQTDRIELVADGRERIWQLEREPWEGDVDATRIAVRKNDSDAPEAPSVETFITFSAEGEVPDQSFVGIDDSILDDIGHLRTSVTFGLRETADGAHLEPLYIGSSQEQRPYIHVFLPTEQRSPIPALLNGTFQVGTSRRSLNMPTEPESGTVVGLNGWLFEQLAETIATDVVAFLDESETTVATFLQCIDITAVLDDDTAAEETTNRCFIEALRTALDGVEFVPRLKQLATGTVVSESDPQPLSQIAVPYTHPDAPNLGKLVVRIYGRDSVKGIKGIEGTATTYLPACSLLETAVGPRETDVASILVALGASRLGPADTPRLLGAAADEHAILQQTHSEDELTLDPVVHALAQTWRVLTNEDVRDEFRDACKQHAVFPVGEQQRSDAGPYYRHDTTPDNVTCFLPPRRTVPSEALAEIRLFPRELYHTGESTQKSALAREEVVDGGEFESILKSIWGIEDFGFQDVAESGIFPLLPGPNTNTADASRLQSVEVIRFIQRLATSQTSGQQAVSPSNPLPYEYRGTEQYYDLCMLPLPTAEGEWRQAHELYFSREWQPEQSNAGQVEELLDRASIDAPVLAPPARFNIDPEDADQLEEWRKFLRWIGVTDHIRPTPLFSPQRQHRYQSTRGVSAPAGSVLDSESARSPTGITREALEQYTADLRDRATDAVDDENERERVYLWQVNGLEYGSELLEAARRDAALAHGLLTHLQVWWDRLSDYTDATVAIYNNKRFRGTQTSYLFTDDEKTACGPNLWVWQLRQLAWFPTSAGATPPEDAWVLSKKDRKRYSIDIDAPDTTSAQRYLLFPTILDEDARSILEQTPSLRETFGIRRRVSSDTIRPADTERYAERIEDVATTVSESPDATLESVVPEIKAAYAYLGEQLPTLDSQGQLTDPAWDPAQTSLDSVPVLCRIGDDLAVRSAKEAYFTRTHDEALRYGDFGVPIFVLTRERTARVGAHLGIADLRDVVDEHPSDGEELVEATADLCAQFLEPAAPFILCRLKATRSGQETLEDDAASVASFIQNVQLVTDLGIEHTLETEPSADPVVQTPEYFIDQDAAGQRSTVYIVLDADSSAVDPPRKVLAKALGEFGDLPNWEAMYVLLQEAPNTQRMRAQLRDAGAPSSAEEVQARRQAVRQRLDGNGSSSIAVVTDEGERPSPTDREPAASLESELHPNKSAEQDEGMTGSAASTVRDGSSVPEPDQLTQIGEQDVVASSSEETSTHERGSGGRSDHQETGTGGSDSSSGTSGGATAEYIDKVDKFGMEATYRAEIERLREEGCEEPERYVHRVHTRQRYEEARADAVAGPALRMLEDLGVSKPYPGFDFLVVDRDTDDPERCIELKSSGTNTRRPSISWNEWKSARNEDIRECYYLYVAVELEQGKSGDARLIEIPDPFGTLHSRERTTRTHSREVQVRLSALNPESGEVVERPIYWEE